MGSNVGVGEHFSGRNFWMLRRRKIPSTIHAGPEIAGISRRPKRVIHIFANGRSIATWTPFDPKPALARLHGKPLPWITQNERRTGGVSIAVQVQKIRPSG